MKKLNLGLIGCGTVGAGVLKLLKDRQSYFKQRFDAEFELVSVCDLMIQKKDLALPRKVNKTKNFKDLIADPDIDVIIELIGGVHPAREIILDALKSKKHVITANKAVLADCGKEIFQQAVKNKRHVYFESSVGAGTPLINSIVEGLAGNRFKGLYGIINGTCNYVLSEMTKNQRTFNEALERAKEKGYAESNPTLDINGMDSAHKLAILVFLALGKSIHINDIYVEGINHISRLDIEYAQSLNLTIKLLAIAKKIKDHIEVRVHPTLISNEHPLASISDVFNAVYLDTDPLGEVLLSGQGAGQMAAAMGVISDLIKLAAQQENLPLQLLGKIIQSQSRLKVGKIGNIETEYYIRLMVIDRPGVLSAISGILGRYGISIASLNQKIRKQASTVPIVMLTHHAKERKLMLALEKIAKLSSVKSKPVAIRMEKL